MKQKDLLKFKLDKICRIQNQKDVLDFIDALIKDPQGELTKIKVEMHTAYAQRQASQIAYKTKLDSDTAELASLDITSVINEAKNK